MTPFDRLSDQRAERKVKGVSRKRQARIVDSRCASDPPTVWAALLRGACNSCPACGASGLFGSFLKPVEQCHVCKEDWTRHNADDFPPYIVILVIGHVIVTGMTTVEAGFHPPMWIQLAIWMPMVIALAVGLLQPVKGGVIALQWWHRMGRFHDRRSTVIPKMANSDALAPDDDRASHSLVIKLPAKPCAPVVASEPRPGERTPLPPTGPFFAMRG
jgi:uncharacterized protein (DUF983 family)